MKATTSNPTAATSVQIVLAGIMLTAVSLAVAQPAVVLIYPDLVREVRRLELLEGDEYRLSNQVLDQRVRLDVRRFAESSDSVGRIDEGPAAFHVQPDDGLVFTCMVAPADFRSGMLEARVVRHDAGTTGRHFFTLSDCAPAK